MAVAEEDTGDGIRRKPADDGVEQSGGIGQSIRAAVSTQDVSNNPDLFQNCVNRENTLWFIFSDASSSEMRKRRMPEVSGFVKL